MEVKIVQRKGVDDGEVVARWTPNEGFVEGDLRFTEDPVYDRYSAEQMIDEFNGPDSFAVPTDEVEKEMGENTHPHDPHGRRYVESVHDAPDDAVVHVETHGDDPDAEKKLYYVEDDDGA